jgi:hypothetical protein
VAKGALWAVVGNQHIATTTLLRKIFLESVQLAFIPTRARCDPHQLKEFS